MRPDLPTRLPKHPLNTALLDHLREQGSPPSGPDDWTLGEWQLHTHPDLMYRLKDLGLGVPLNAAYGVPLLAYKGVAAAVAMGTDTLLLRLPSVPDGLEADTPVPALTRHGWRAVNAWQPRLRSIDGDHRLLLAVEQALLHTRDLIS
ncbi:MULTISPECIES: hypothetical protein [unclassified Streptomyces]|uniref:hypothetical protein n=1 Tax=unclassified Streptomyces TaxID=2593676 RepID=UPI00225AAC3B|nr:MULTISPECIES: hypothetical protein [unclassified Streptomyces]MCX5334250.1 hypothetical protein [Streptomyces sp. NBC_00140]MCX5363758.1 hypothetical protein [Streptomyces sp. NBC_00124]